MFADVPTPEAELGVSESTYELLKPTGVMGVKTSLCAKIRIFNRDSYDSRGSNESILYVKHYI